eukprot:gene33030-42732_t
MAKNTGTSKQEKFEEKISMLEHRASKFEKEVNSLVNFLDLGLTRNANGHFTYSIHGTFIALDLMILESRGRSILQYNEGSFTADESATIESRDKFCIIYILAQNYLTAFYMQFYENIECNDSQAYLHKHVHETFKKRKDIKIHDLLMDRIEVCAQMFSDARKTLDRIRDDTDQNFCHGSIFRRNPASTEWNKRMEIRGYKGESSKPTYVFKNGNDSSHINVLELFDDVLTCFDIPTPMPMPISSKSKSDYKDSRSSSNSNSKAISSKSKPDSKDSSSSSSNSNSKAISSTSKSDSKDRSSSSNSNSKAISSTSKPDSKDSRSSSNSNSKAISSTSKHDSKDSRISSKSKHDSKDSSSSSNSNSKAISSKSKHDSKDSSSSSNSNSKAISSKSKPDSKGTRRTSDSKSKSKSGLNVGKDSSEEEEFTGDIDCSEIVATNVSDPQDNVSESQDIEQAIATLSEFLSQSNLGGTFIESASSSTSLTIVSTAAEDTPIKVRQLLFGLLHENHQLKQKEFQVSIELIFRYVTYQQHFSKFFIMCESFPVAFSEGLLEQESLHDARTRTALIKASEDYLCRLASNLMDFFKQFLQLGAEMESSDLVRKIFPSVMDSQKEKYCAVLDDPAVRSMIRKVSREDQLFIELCSKRDFKTSRHYLLDNLVSKFCNSDIETLRSDESKEYIISIMRNIKYHKGLATKDNVTKITRMLEQYVDKNNPFDYRTEPLNNRQLRSSISVIDYSGMESSAISSKKSSGRSSSDAAEGDADAEGSDADAEGDAKSEDSDAEGGLSIEVSEAEGDAKSEDSDAEGGLSIEDSEAEGDAVKEESDAEGGLSIEDSEAEGDAVREESDAEGGLSIEDSEAEGDAVKEESDAEDSEAEGDAVKEDSGAGGDAKLRKRILIAENDDVDSEGEGHLPKRTKETGSLSHAVSVVAYPVMEVDTNSSLPRAEKSPATFSSPVMEVDTNSSLPRAGKSPASVPSPVMEVDTNSSLPRAENSPATFSFSSFPSPPQTNLAANSSSSPPLTTVGTPAADSSFLSTKTSPDLETSSTESFHQYYKLMLSIFGRQETTPFHQQQSIVKDSVKFVIKSVLQICAEWKIDLSADILNESDNSSSQLTLEDKAFWMQVFIDYRMPNEVSFEKMEECNGGIDPSSSHRCSSIISDTIIKKVQDGLTPNPKVADDAAISGKGSTADDQHGGVVSSSHSNGLSPNPEDADSNILNPNHKVADAAISGNGSTAVNPLDAEMQDGGDSNGLSPSPKVALLPSANADTPADIARIHRVSDRIASSQAIDENCVRVIKAKAVPIDTLSAGALSLFLYAIRTHAMTRHFFLDRPSYRQLNFAAYQRHKEFLFLFDSPEISFHFDDISHALQFPPFNGDRTLTAVINHMFPRDRGYELNLIPAISLPRRDFVEDPLLSLNKLVQNAILANVEANSAVDMSVVFMDFTTCDKKGNAAVVIGFPNRVVFKHKSVHFVYQTIGAVYKRIDEGVDKYAIRIVSRGRGRGEYFYLDYFGDFDCLVFKKQLPGGFNYQEDHDEEAFKRPVFSPQKYLQVEVEVLQNKQKLSPTFQLSLGVVDPVYSCCGQMLRAREMRILESTDWLTDEIIYAAMLKFMQTTNYDEDSDGSPVIIPPTVFGPMVGSLVKDEDATRSRKTSKRVVDELFAVAYWQCKVYWEYKNLFSRKSWFFAIVNYPDNSHWMFFAKHSGQKVYFVNDPLHDTGNVQSLVRVVDAYIDFEAESYCADFNESADVLKTLQHTTWTYLPSRCQQQNDKCNCGVLSLIAFFRSMNIVMAVPTVSAADLAAKWTCNVTVSAQSHYRSKLKAMLVENGGDSLEACIYFSQTLPQYIEEGNLQFEV